MTTLAQPATASDRALELEQLAKRYKAARDVLETRVQTLEDEVAAAHRRKLPGIKSALATAVEAKDALNDEIERNRDLFTKPKTMTLHATRFGLMKGKGSIDWDDDSEVISRIKKQLPDQVAELVVITEKPKKSALQDLDVKSLRRLGITVADTGEVPFIKAVGGDATKMVKRLLKESTGRIPEEDN